ncbi:hypothetical protein BC939DRAFT_450325 [Gamsiella multidivaricata]|uniref:uncharacterized protein n=1 Tax=Gamsiella multidivaricata TaxID=101098 RepID=UPI00222117C1|nr:uncharacterized protein BC939DRAFT_450325 [Gamsiella multidivaricata]KAG0363018.1 hypothetical protein BGZ54_008381 [Gamsiella multidivaricata]KAI7824428.1 hypothetical protein BC939DRAFT_450325 [Gamsiella multidivaricata]
MTNKVSNTVHEAVGATKEKVGRATGNESLAARGAAQNAQAHANQDALKANTHAHGVANNVQGATQRTVGSATNDHSMQARGHANEALGDVQRNY